MVNDYSLLGYNEISKWWYYLENINNCVKSNAHEKKWEEEDEEEEEVSWFWSCSAKNDTSRYMKVQ